ncbi:hypothetical protein [uncultured Brachyspira sp.]|uniref:hypothetical protein n=1 Tax=uncultured Brachyspira sp. TaxID=221953 RepID=UPI002635E661|nr:hypothetical protein [uncultured Brachyspira sp.]
MIKKSILFIIFLVLVSCSSPYGGAGGVKFSNRKGIYEDEAKKVAVEINDKENNNLIITVLGNTAGDVIINETLSVNSEASGIYMTVKSQLYEGYTYMLNLGNNANNIFITIKDGQGNDIIFNEKLSKQKNNNF